MEGALASDIRKSERGGKTAYLEMSVWYDADHDQIHMTVPKTGWFHTTVNEKPESERCHPNLFRKLARALKEAGVPGPSVRETDDD